MLRRPGWWLVSYIAMVGIGLIVTRLADTADTGLLHIALSSIQHNALTLIMTIPIATWIIPAANAVAAWLDLLFAIAVYRTIARGH